ncbi:MAG: amidohydrolase family protein [Rhodomicrobium sp.]
MPELDLAIYGAKIVTLDKTSSIASAVGLRDGVIAAVGPEELVSKDKGPNTRILDATCKTIIPGLLDAHPHMDRHGLKSRGGISLAGCNSIAEIQDVIREAAKRTPTGEWIVLMPMGTPPTDYIYRPDQLAEGRFPTRHDLDKAAPDHPVYIRAPWGWWSHRPFPSVANTAAMQIAGVTANTQLPYNTVAVAEDGGSLSSVFLDRNYAPLMEYTLFKCVPRFTYEDRIAGVRLGSAAYSAVGTTAAYEGHGVTPQILDAYRHVHAAGDLGVRMQIPLSVPTAAFANRKIADILYHWAGTLKDRGTGDDMLRLEGVSHSMLFAMWQALSRWDNDSKTRLGESNLTREEALRLSTVTGHGLTWDEGNRGPLEAGKAADFVVLADDPLTCAEDQIKDIAVERTFVGGKEIFSSAAQSLGQAHSR